MEEGGEFLCDRVGSGNAGGSGDIAAVHLTSNWCVAISQSRHIKYT